MLRWWALLYMLEHLYLLFHSLLRLGARRRIIRNAILLPLVVGEVAQQARTEILHRRAIIHIPQPRRAVIADGGDRLPSGEKATFSTPAS